MKIVGKVLDEEKKELQELFEKRTALETLLKCIDLNDSILYEKIIEDYAGVQKKFDHWWSEMYKKYNWETGDSWQIDFNTNEIITLGPKAQAQQI